MNRFVTAVLLVGCVSTSAHAQWVVYDAATTARNSVTAVIKDYLLDTQRSQHERIRQMAERLSALTDLRKYVIPGSPDWRRVSPDSIYVGGFNTALTAGDNSGASYRRVIQPVSEVPTTWAPARLQTFTARLATIDVADAINASAIDTIGTVRSAGQGRESAAINALESHVVDPSPTQSATAVLDKVNGAVLIGTRQRQTRTRLLSGVVEQLLVENKRARDTEAAASNMQLATWRNADAANDAFRAGTGDALRTWRQP